MQDKQKNVFSDEVYVQTEKSSWGPAVITDNFVINYYHLHQYSNIIYDHRGRRYAYVGFIYI
jgi:hypothetical protein